MRELIQDYTAGGTKYKDIDDKVIIKFYNIWTFNFMVA